MRGKTLLHEPAIVKCDGRFVPFDSTTIFELIDQDSGADRK